MSGIHLLSNDYHVNKHKFGLDSGWKPEKHDKGLMYSVSDLGFDYFKIFSSNSEYGLEDVKIDKETANNRIEYI